MKKIILFSSIAAVIAIVSCTKNPVQPAYTPPVVFKVNSKLVHLSDTLSTKGDTIWVKAQGNAVDTTGKYPISVTLTAVDSLLNTIYASAYLNPVAATYDTTGLAASGLYHWTALLALPIPPLPVKTGGKPTAIITKGNFGYGLSTSSGITASTATDTKNIHLK